MDKRGLKNPLCTQRELCITKKCVPPYECVSIDYGGVVPSLERILRMERLLKYPIEKIIQEIGEGKDDM